MMMMMFLPRAPFYAEYVMRALFTVHKCYAVPCHKDTKMQKQAAVVTPCVLSSWLPQGAAGTPSWLVDEQPL